MNNFIEQPKINLTGLIAPSFFSAHHAIRRHDFTHHWFKGGRGSTKSTFISVEIILGMMKNPEQNAICFRKVGETLKESVYEQLVWAIEHLGVGAAWKLNLSPLGLTYKPTGQKIIFRGVDDAKKSKSIKLRKGYFAYVWYEEVDEFSGMAELDTINRSLLRGGVKFWVFYSFNPPQSKNNWVNYEVSLPRPDKLIHSSTYLTVPPEWLGPQFVIEAEHVKAVNPERYRHEFMGEVTGTGGEVFRNVTLREISNHEIANFDRIKRGLDWGYSLDPFCYLTTHYDKTRKRLYLYYEYYKLNVSNSKAVQVIEAENDLNELVRCDSAEPKSVKYLKDSGINAKGVKKKPGSVEYSTKFLADELEEIIIDPVRCPNAAREFTTYELEKDRLGNFKAEYPDKNNHAIDATRYALIDDMNPDVVSVGRVNI